MQAGVEPSTFTGKKHETLWREINRKEIRKKVGMAGSEKSKGERNFAPREADLVPGGKEIKDRGVNNFGACQNLGKGSSSPRYAIRENDSAHIQELRQLLKKGGPVRSKLENA